MNCVRISHPDVKELAKQMNLPRSVVASKIAVWQDTNNNLDRFPTLEELLKPSSTVLIESKANEEFNKNFNIAKTIFNALGIDKIIAHFTTPASAKNIKKEGYKKDQKVLFTIGDLQSESKGITQSFMPGVMYFTTDEKRWGKAKNIYVGEGKGTEDFSFYDYDQKTGRVTLKKAAKTLELEPVYYFIKDNASSLEINSEKSFENYVSKAKSYFAEKFNKKEFDYIKDFIPYMQNIYGKQFDAYSDVTLILAYAKENNFDIVNINNKGSWGKQVVEGELESSYDIATGYSGNNDFFVFNSNSVGQISVEDENKAKALYQKFINQGGNPNDINSLKKFIKQSETKETPLAKTIRTQLSSMFPQVKVFNDKQQFLDYINAVHDAGITFFDAIGAAYANSIYIDPEKAQQDTYFHEIAHLYWKALPNDNPVKQQLIKAYVTEERAVTAIGKAGVDIAALKVPGMSMTKINALWKQFWSATKSLFGIKTDADYARIMANDIWNNKEMFEAFTNNEIEFQKLFGFIPIRDVTKKQKDVELMEDDYSRIIDMRSDIPINQWTRANVTQIRMFNERATNLVADPDVIVRQIQAKLNGFKEDIPAGKTLQDLTPFEYMSIVNQHPMVDVDGPTSIDTQIDPKSLTWITSGDKKTYKGLSKAKWIERVKQSGEHPNILSMDYDIVDKLYNRYLLDMEKIQNMFEGYTNYLDFIYAPSQGYAGKKGLSDMIFMLKTLESKEAANFALNDVSQLIYDEILVKNIATEALPGYSAYKEYTILMGKMLMGERTKQFNTWLSQEAISQMNVKNIHAQVIFDAIAKETQKINITTAALLKKLKEYQKAIKKEGRSTAECKVLATSGKYQIETWVSDPSQLASLSRNQRRYIEVAKEILRTIGYDSEIIPQARMGFWDSFFSTSAWSTKPFWKRITIIPALINFEFARMNGLTARTSYDNIYVTYNGVTEKVVSHREKLVRGVKNKKISIGKAKSEMKKIIEKAEELRKNGVDDALEVIYNNDTYEISTNFGKVFDAYSVSNFDAVINNFVKAQTFKYYMEPMLPTVDIFKKNFIESEAKKKFAEQWFDKTMSTLLSKSTKDQSAKKWVESGINFYTGWTAFRFLGFNWQAAVMNLTAGYSNNITHFGIGVVMRGHERLVKNPKKCYAILDKLNIVSTTVDESFNLSQHYQTVMNQLTFFTSTAPEYINQGTVFIGMMTDEQFNAYDSNGNIKEYVIDPTTGERKIAPKGVKGTLDTNALDANQINLMQMQIARVHGAYHKLFKRPVAQNVLLRPVVMFKTWMFEMYNMFFGDLDFVRGGIRQKSIIKDTGKTLFNRMFADIRGLADKPEWTEADRQNVKKFVTLSFLIVGAAIASGMTDDDDKKGLLGRIFKSIYSLGVEYRKEAVTVVSPILVTLWDSMELFVYGVTQEKYERGKHKGEPKWQYRAKTLTPFRALWKDDPNESIKNEDELDDYQLFLKEQKEAMKEAGLPEIEEETQVE